MHGRFADPTRSHQNRPCPGSPQHSPATRGFGLPSRAREGVTGSHTHALHCRQSRPRPANPFPAPSPVVGGVAKRFLGSAQSGPKLDLEVLDVSGFVVNLGGPAFEVKDVVSCDVQVCML